MKFFSLGDENFSQIKDRVMYSTVSYLMRRNYHYDKLKKTLIPLRNIEELVACSP